MDIEKPPPIPPRADELLRRIAGVADVSHKEIRDPLPVDRPYEAVGGGNGGLTLLT